MKKYVAKIIRQGAKWFDYLRAQAETMEDAIEAFKAALNRHDTLVEVKGGHQPGEMVMPESSGPLNWVKEYDNA